MAPTIRHAANALKLRRLVLQVATAGPESARRAWTDALEVPGPAWRLFLAVERCGGLLAKRLRDLALPAPPPDHPLASSELDDVKRSLSARAALASIARIASATGTVAVALKGAACVGQESFHLMDVDVMVRKENADEFAARLADLLASDRKGEPSIRHLAVLGMEAALPVEVHTNIDNRWTGLGPSVWDHLRPLESSPPLRRLGARDHALHLLTHMVIDHMERRGRLRDTFLLAMALGDLTPADVDWLRGVARATPFGGVLTLQLDLSERVRGRAPGADPFEAAAFAHYWMMERAATRALRNVPFLGALHPTTWKSTVALVSRWSQGQLWRDGLNEPTVARANLAVTRSLEALNPGLGRMARVSVRFGVYALSQVAAWPLSIRVRADARRAGLSLP